MNRLRTKAKCLAACFCLLMASSSYSQQPVAEKINEESVEKQGSKTTASSTFANQMVPPDILVSFQPLITQLEALGGEPFGIGRLSFRMRQGDEMILQAGAPLLTERNNRILYPVQTQSQFKSFLETITGRESIAPDDLHTILFLFKGDQPLELRLDGSGTTFETVNVAMSQPRRFRRFINLWWREFELMARKQMDGGDYPGIIETYLTSMLQNRMSFEEPRRRGKKRDELSRTLDLLFDVETLRMDAIQRAMSGRADTELASLPIPPAIRWTPVKIDNLPADVDIEPIAKSVPEECFYLRFGTWKNQLWIDRLMEEFGGDLGRMIKLRGYKPKIQNKFLDQLAIQSTEFDQLFGGNLIDDVAVVGMDAYFSEGATIGVILHAKITGALNKNLLNKRKQFVRSKKKFKAKLIESEYRGYQIQFLTTPDNRYRSFYVVHGNNHFVTTSLALARRFVDASEGERCLADSDEFRFARTQMPLAREDTVFVYLSTRFFQQLLSPKYQIELRRRNRVVSDMQLLEAARLAASHEGVNVNDLDVLTRQGFLPAGFGQRPDNSHFVQDGRIWSDSIRGRRGFFTPIADMAFDSVSQDEHEWYTKRARYFTQSINSLDPVLVGVKRFEHETKSKVERVIFDARISPFNEEKYGWLTKMLGPPLEYQIAGSPNDVVSLQASLRKKGVTSIAASDHHVFAAMQDELDPSMDLSPSTAIQWLQTLKEAPAYLGSWPNAGYLDWLPALGSEPDQHGFTYSRILGLWRLHSGDFSVIAFNRERLENLKPTLSVVPSERPAQIRLIVGDLQASVLREWVNSINYRRSWETSIANVRFLNMLTQQFGIAPEITLAVAQQMLNVDLVCSLGGEYQLYELSSGRKLWASSAWPSFVNPVLPVDYRAPLLTWFRGAEVELIKSQSRFVVHGYVDIERQKSDTKLPSFDVMKGFSNLFGVGAKKKDSKRASEPKPKETDKTP